MRWPKLLRSSKTPAKAYAADWEKRANALLARIEKDRDGLEALNAKLLAMTKQIDTDLEQVEELKRRHQVALDGLGSELAVAEGTVEVLERSHRLILKRIDADLAVQTRREVALTNREDDGE